MRQFRGRASRASASCGARLRAFGLIVCKSMDSAVAGLFGAGIGALAGIAGAVMTHSLQTRLERQIGRAHV